VRTFTTNERYVDFWRPKDTTLTVCGSSDRRLHFEIVRRFATGMLYREQLEGAGAWAAQVRWGKP